MALRIKFNLPTLWAVFGQHTPDESSSFFRKTAWNAIASIANMVSRLAANIIIFRSLGLDGTGQVAFLMWASETTAVVFSTGIGESLPRYLAELSNQHAKGATLARWIFGRYSLQSLGALLLLGISAPIWMAPHFEVGLAWSFCVMLCARLMSGFYQSFLTGLQRYDLLARVNIISSALLLIGVLLGVRTWGVSGALLGYAIGTLLPSLLSLQMLKAKDKPIKLEPVLKKRFWNFSFFIWISNILGAFVWGRIEIPFLHLYWTDSEVALFSVPQNISNQVSTLAGMLSGAFMPYFAQLSGVRNTEKISAVFGSGNRILAFILFPVCLGGASLMPVLLPLVYGHKIDAAIPNAMVLFAASFITISNINTALILGLDRSRFFAANTFVGALISITAGFTVIRIWGSWGAVWSKSIIQVGLIFANYIYIERGLGFPVPFKALGRLMLSATLCGIASGMVLHYFSNLSGLLVAILAGAVVYGAGIRIFGGLETVDVGHLERILKKLPGSLRHASEKLLRLVVPVAKSSFLKS